MFSNIGWLDSEYNFDNNTASADVASLPAEVSESKTDVILNFL